MKHLAQRYFVTISFVAVLTTAGCGGEEEATSSDISTAAPVTASCNTSVYQDSLGYTSLMSKHKNNVQCQAQIQNAEAMRQAAIANCSAGDLPSATKLYSQYKTLVSYVGSVGCK